MVRAEFEVDSSVDLYQNLGRRQVGVNGRFEKGHTKYAAPSIGPILSLDVALKAMIGRRGIATLKSGRDQQIYNQKQKRKGDLLAA